MGHHRCSGVLQAGGASQRHRVPRVAVEQVDGALVHDARHRDCGVGAWPRHRLVKPEVQHVHRVQQLLHQRHRVRQRGEHYHSPPQRRRLPQQRPQHRQLGRHGEQLRRPARQHVGERLQHRPPLQRRLHLRGRQRSAHDRRVACWQRHGVRERWLGGGAGVGAPWCALHQQLRPHRRPRQLRGGLHTLQQLRPRQRQQPCRRRRVRQRRPAACDAHRAWVPGHVRSAVHARQSHVGHQRGAQHRLHRAPPLVTARERRRIAGGGVLGGGATTPGAAATAGAGAGASTRPSTALQRRELRDAGLHPARGVGARQQGEGATELRQRRLHTRGNDAGAIGAAAAADGTHHARRQLHHHALQRREHGRAAGTRGHGVGPKGVQVSALAHGVEAAQHAQEGGQVALGAGQLHRLLHLAAGVHCLHRSALLRPQGRLGAAVPPLWQRRDQVWHPACQRDRQHLVAEARRIDGPGRLQGGSASAGVLADPVVDEGLVGEHIRQQEARQRTDTVQRGGQPRRHERDALASVQPCHEVERHDDSVAKWQPRRARRHTTAAAAIARAVGANPTAAATTTTTVAVAAGLET